MIGKGRKSRRSEEKRDKLEYKVEINRRLIQFEKKYKN